MPTTTTANRRHLDEAVQFDALAIRLERTDGRMTSYDVVAERLGLNNANAAMYACERESIRRVGDTSLTAARRAVRVTARSAAWLTARTFGIEIECARGTMRREAGDHIAANYPVTTAAAHMRAAGLQAQPEAYSHNTPTVWKVTYDSTVTGVEAVSPILSSDDGYRQVRLACEGLRAAGANPGGGVHVHHGVTDFTTAQLVNLVDVLEAAQGALRLYMPLSRQRSSWCAQMGARSFTSIRDALTAGTLAVRSGGSPVSRYSFFNFASLARYGTVEFRGHGASLSGAKLVRWIKVGQAVIEFARRGGTLPAAVAPAALMDTLVAEGLLAQDVATAFVARVEALHGAAAVR
jgi:hypothetical protein